LSFFFIIATLKKSENLLRIEMKRLRFYSISTLLLILIFIIVYNYLSDSITTVILVRHTEKEALPADDPPLSAEGVLRAQSLLHAVKNMEIDVIFVTEFKRTMETVEPTANHFGLLPVILAAADIEDLVNSINSDYKGKQILVAGHSNTIPAIIESLGISTPPTIASFDYDDLFLVGLHNNLFRYVELITLQYGIPTP
jgi:broad specificity phosphatase PhoE